MVSGFFHGESQGGRKPRGGWITLTVKRNCFFLAQFIIISHVTQRPKGPFRVSVPFDGWRIAERKTKVFQTETPIIFFTF